MELWVGDAGEEQGPSIKASAAAAVPARDASGQPSARGRDYFISYAGADRAGRSGSHGS